MLDVENRRKRDEATRDEVHWIDVCALDDIVPGTGVAAMLFGVQVAVVRHPREHRVFVISNFDPFSRAFVLARGIVGDRGGVPKIASPIFKQNFNLETGECFDDARVRIPVYPSRISGGRVEIDVTRLWSRRS